jgi:transcriptional regulator with XRE-family HTH domain
MDGKLTKQIKKIIADSGLSENQIALQAGIDKSALSRFRTSERSLTLASLDKMADVLGLELVTRKRKGK